MCLALGLILSCVPPATASGPEAKSENVVYDPETKVATLTITETKQSKTFLSLLETAGVDSSEIRELHVIADESLGLNEDNTLELTIPKDWSKEQNGFKSLEVLTFSNYLTAKNDKLSSSSLKGLSDSLREFAMPAIRETSAAFRNFSKLETVELGDVSTVGAYSFAECTSLKTIKLYTAQPPALVMAADDPDGTWFNGVDTKSVTVQVPKWDERVTNEMPINQTFKDDDNWGNTGSEEGMNYGFQIEEYDDPRYISVAYLPEAKEEVELDSVVYGKLSSAVDSYCKEHDITRNDIRKLTIKSGTLGPDDCAFIRSGLKMLEELYVVGEANFSTEKNSVDGIIPTSAFRGHGRLKRVEIDNAVEVSKEAFSLIPTLEFVDLPKVEKLQTQAFAMQKFSSNSQLKEIRLPSLKWTSNRVFYYNVRLETLILGSQVPEATTPEGKEGLWFNYVTKVTVYIPGTEEVYSEYVDEANLSGLYWGAFSLRPYRDLPESEFGDFTYDPSLDDGFEFPPVKFADEYNDRDLDYLREKYLNPVGHYYSGDVELSLNMYSFNAALNRAIKAGQETFLKLDMERVDLLLEKARAGQATEKELWEFLKGCYGETNSEDITTIDAIQWAVENGFKAVDLTFYYVPGYSNIGWTNVDTAAPKEEQQKAKEDTQKKFELNVLFLKLYCENHGIAISGTGIQNSFSDSNPNRVTTDVERMKFYLTMSNLMGAPCMRVFTGTAPVDISLKGWKPIMDERVIPALEEVAAYAKEKELTTKLGIQNHGDMLSTANQILYTVDCLIEDGYGNNVVIVNDTGYYREFGQIEYPEADQCYQEIERVLPVSGNFQLKKKPRGAESADIMDLERVFTDMRKSNYLDPADGSKRYVPLEVLWAPGDTGDYPYPENQSEVIESYKEQIVQYLKMVKAAVESTRTGPLFSVLLPEQPVHYSVSSEPGQAHIGETVNVTVKASSGYTVVNVIATGADGVQLKVTANGSRTYSFTMPACDVQVSVTVRVKSVTPGDSGNQPGSEEKDEPNPWTNPFSDVSEEDWFYTGVAYVAARKLMVGIGNSEFSPNAAATRGMTMTILARLSGENTDGGDPWYQIGVEWAVEHGVSDGTNPETPITREELVVMLWRYADCPVVGTSGMEAFPDAGTVSSWAVDAMTWAVETGLILGRNGELCSHSGATRAEIALVLARFNENTSS